MRRKRRRVAPVDTVEPPDCKQSPSSNRVECGKCAKTYVATAVVTEPDVFTDEDNTQYALRRLYCDHCGHVQIWRELITLDPFTLTGHILGELAYLKSRKYVELFLIEHPHTAGVSQK